MAVLSRYQQKVHASLFAIHPFWVPDYLAILVMAPCYIEISQIFGIYPGIYLSIYPGEYLGIYLLFILLYILKYILVYILVYTLAPWHLFCYISWYVSWYIFWNISWYILLCTITSWYNFHSHYKDVHC